MKTVAMCLAALAGIGPVSAIADDQCHGTGPEPEYFIGGEDALLGCLNSGGMSWMTVGADPLAYAIRKTTSPIRLEDVFISGAFSAKSAAYSDSPPDNSNVCGAIRDATRVDWCRANPALVNDIEFERVSSDGVLDLSGVTFVGQLTIEEPKTEVWLDGSIFLKMVTVTAPAGYVSTGGITSAAPFNIDGWTSEVLSISEGAFFGPLTVNDVALERLSIRQSHVDAANLSGVKVTGEVFIYESTFRDLDLSNSQVGTSSSAGDLTIADTEVTGRLDLSGAAIAGTLRLASALAGRAVVSGLVADRVCTINVDCP